MADPSPPPPPAGAPPAAASSSPLMANLNRLSHATSRPDLPPHESFTSRTIRAVGSALSPEQASEELDSLILRNTAHRRPSVAVDSSILYPTLEQHGQAANGPLLVLNLAAISHVPLAISNDELLEVLLRRLEPWVGEDGEGAYSLIVLAAEGDGDRPLPGVAWWLWHWRRIPRKFRKNLKRLYIVHPSTLTRTVLPLIVPLVSPKSYGKVITVPSLLALTHLNIPLRGMDLTVPTLVEEARVLAEDPNAAQRSSVTDAVGRRASTSLAAPPEAGASGWGAFSMLSAALGTATSWLHPNVSAALADRPPPPYWSRDIDAIVSENNGHVPRVLGAIGTAILAHCASTEGIFRRSSNSPLAPVLQSLLDLDLDLQPRLDWAALAQHDPLLPPLMLKRVVSKLRPPVFMHHLYPTIRASHTVADLETKLIPALSQARAQLLDVVLHIAYHLLPHERATRMGARQLALMFAPSLISGPDPREDLALLMERGVAVPAGLTPARKSSDSDRTGRSSTSASASPQAAALPLPDTEAQTLVGVLEMWITNLPALHEKEGCDCAMIGKASPVTPLAGHGPHALLNAQSAGARAPPVATAS
ncbi:hypothetical protein CC85DRAFT_285756 [Cutaneotrichosporon oleaginosum]|uniref:Rho-GAP domain-containing protein n=1 Tax=Cutaneotrichosporon oleaginosum TaxID=879819 RepID=A0A0J0XM25_9TREE|nr:uncharacterized protein CC85DRAFT_285756 [Cutaneotrichosporon oleaginosum]KLT42166.1 hypothetical protein CC85DRAFT_285756 [Cutaneotrichosporon oleaginosum]TXT11711.1 hypothetical protein COLE_02121 [Cutaneotrichosporon oleaginosum]